MKGKKGGWYFEALFILIIVMIIGYALVVVYGKTNISRNFGDVPRSIMETYHEGEKILFYVDYAAKNSIYQAAYDLWQKGGFYGPDCENYLGYALWNDECPLDSDSLKYNFSLYLNDALNSYLVEYPDENVAISLNNYDFLIKDDLVVGIATENIEIDVREVKVKWYEAIYDIPKGADAVLRKIKSTYGPYFGGASSAFSVQDSVITAVIAQESAGNPNLVSRTGCKGLMQFCAATAYEYGLCDCVGSDCGKRGSDKKYCVYKDDRHDSIKSIEAGSLYLSRLLNQFKDHAHGEEFAIASYNGGSEVIKKAIRKTGKDDPSWQEVSQQLTPDLITYFSDYNEKRNKLVEIKDYVRKVEGYKTKYEEIMGGGIDVVETVENVDENEITTAAVEEGTSEEVKILGRYSIKPSFNQKLDFNILEDYDTLAEKAEQLKDICKESENVVACVSGNRNIFNENNLRLSDNCEPVLKRAFIDFAERIYLCAHSDFSNCICKLNTPEGDYDSILLEQNKIKMVGGDETLFELDFDVDYEGVSNFIINTEIILLNEDNKLKGHNQEDMGLCPTQKTTFRFCIENNNKQVYAYSDEDKETTLRNIQYRFALKFD